MNCRYVQSHLSAYIDMELTGWEQQRIRAHLECCLDCSAEYETLRRMKHLMRHLPTVIPLRGPEAVLQRLHRQRVVEQGRRRLIWRTRWWRYAWGAAATVALLFWFSAYDEENPIRPMQSDTLTPTFSSTYSNRTVPLPLLQRSQNSPLISTRYEPNPAPIEIWMTPNPSTLYPSQPAVMPTGAGWQPVDSFQPAFGLQVK